MNELWYEKRARIMLMKLTPGMYVNERLLARLTIKIVDSVQNYSANIPF